jgi:hypothetical protein
MSRSFAPSHSNSAGKSSSSGRAGHIVSINPDRKLPLTGVLLAHENLTRSTSIASTLPFALL